MEAIEQKDKSEETEGKKTANAFERFKKTKTWTLIEILSPIFAIGVPLALYFYSEKSGQVTVSGIQRTSLIDTRNAVGQDVTVLYRNNRIANLVSYTLELTNTGNTDIGKDDIYKLKWLAPTNSQILDARIAGKTGDFGDFISLDVLDPRTLNFNILALNKGVAVKINILCSSESFNVDDSTSRFDGVIRGAAIVDNSKAFTSPQKSSFLENIFAGGLWTNIAKAVVFFVITVFVFVLILIPIAKIQNWKDKKKNIEVIKAKEAEREAERERERQQVISIARGTVNEKELADPDTVRWLSQTIDFFKSLNQQQFDLCRRVVENSEKHSFADVILADVFTQKEKDVMRNIPEVQDFFDSILRYKSIYKPGLVVEALVQKGQFADNPQT